MNGRLKIVVIGGSAGSFEVVTKILGSLSGFDLPVVLCLHRLKHVRNGFTEALNLKSKIKVIEPCDKERIRGGQAYLAPANYHLLAELGYTFALSTDEMVKFSRPSIDLTFDTISNVYRDKMLGILLSGANTDGCWGISQCAKRGGYTIVQDPEEAGIKTMPEGALKLFKPNEVLKTEKIIQFLKTVN